MIKPLAGLAFMALAAMPPTASAQDAAAQDDVQRSVVKIFASVSPPNPFRPWEVTAPSDISGTGVVMEGKKILTNAHVVAHAVQIYVQPNKSADKLGATVEFMSESYDLALLKLDDPAEIGDVKEMPLAEGLPKLKDKINVMGYPMGGDALSVTEGVVSRIELVSYTARAYGLRIQVDAAVNPGNSGGPGIVDGKVAGIVFGKLSGRADNIGYLIPTEVIRHFLEDGTSNSKHDGFPMLDITWATIENPALRRYLKLDKKDTGVVLHRVDQPGLGELLKPWDVITECEGVPIDNLGMVQIEDGLRVDWPTLVARKPTGSVAKLKVIREGARVDVEVPTASYRDIVAARMTRERPTYFIYGGLVFSPVTMDMLERVPSEAWVRLAIGGRLIMKHWSRLRSSPDDELVALCMKALPHKLTKGYDPSVLSVVTHVNDQPVKGLRHMISLIKENKGDFIVFRFEDDRVEKVVLDPKDVKKHTPEILRNNNIPAECSDDLKDLWP